MTDFWASEGGADMLLLDVKAPMAQTPTLTRQLGPRWAGTELAQLRDRVPGRIC